VPSKSKPLSKSELAAYETTRDLAAELLQSVREMKAGHVQVVSSPVIEARKKTGLSQSQFAALLGVSVRTLQGWEQGRKQPSGAARTLLAIASEIPRHCWLLRTASSAESKKCPTIHSSGRLRRR
jgi:putative transcriptional regulator